MRRTVFVLCCLLSLATGAMLTAFVGPHPDTLRPVVSTIDVFHQCVDFTHKTCDGGCECDGLGCSNSDKLDKLLFYEKKSYQIELGDKGTTVYDDGVVVGFLPFDTTQHLDQLMLELNR